MGQILEQVQDVLNHFTTSGAPANHPLPYEAAPPQIPPATPSRPVEPWVCGSAGLG